MFPEIYREKVNVGSYIPEDRLDNVIAKILNRINKIVADVRKDLTTITVERETVDISVDLAKQLTITVPVGTTKLEMIKINKVIKEEVMVVQLTIPESVLDQSQLEGYPGYIWQIVPTFVCGSGGTTYPDVIPNLKIAQTFTAGISGLLTKFETVFYNELSEGDIGTPGSGNLNISIQTVDINGLPTGEILSSINIDVATLGYINDYYNFNFPVPATLVSGTKYAFVIEPTLYVSYGMGAGLYINGQISLDPYDRGTFLVYYNNTWQTVKESGLDGNFWGGLGSDKNYCDSVFKTYISID